ncbi:MAG: HEAT repeat domain-containing protein [Planctomycetota bacterium]
MKRWKRLLLSALGAALIAGCSGAETGDGGGDGPGDGESGPDPVQEALQAREAAWNAFQFGVKELSRELPPVLAKFETDDPRQWREARAAVAASKFSSAVDPGRLNPDATQADSPLTWCTERGAKGERARRDLAMLGRLYAAAGGFESPNPEDWTRARKAMASLGPRGEDSAAVILILKLQPMDLPAGIMANIQREIAGLGPGALRVARIALERANWVVVERLLPALADIGDPAVAMLVELLDHKNEDTVRVALRALIVAGGPAAARPLQRFAAPGQPWRARAYALQALGSSKSPEAADPLIAACADDDGFVARSAAEALGRLLKGTKHRGAVRAALQLHGRSGEEYADARRAGLDAARRITGSPRARAEAIRKWLENEGG